MKLKLSNESKILEEANWYYYLLEGIALVYGNALKDSLGVILQLPFFYLDNNGKKASKTVVIEVKDNDEF